MVVSSEITDVLMWSYLKSRLRIYKDAQVGKDASGRLIYKNENNNNRLQFNPQVGKWCIGSSCTGGVGCEVLRGPHRVNHDGSQDNDKKEFIATSEGLIWGLL